MTLAIAMKLAKTELRNSGDPKVQVGAVAWLHPKLVAGTNRFPTGTQLPPSLPREFVNKRIVHAEREAIYKAARDGISLNGAEIYSTLYPCSQCAQAIVSAGIKRVYTHERPDLPEWTADWLIADQVFAECGVEVVLVKA